MNRVLRHTWLPASGVFGLWLYLGQMIAIPAQDPLPPVPPPAPHEKATAPTIPPPGEPTSPGLPPAAPERPKVPPGAPVEVELPKVEPTLEKVAPAAPNVAPLPAVHPQPAVPAPQEPLLPRDPAKEPSPAMRSASPVTPPAFRPIHGADVHPVVPLHSTSKRPPSQPPHLEETIRPIAPPATAAKCEPLELKVEKTGPANGKVGDVLEYHIKVRNVSTTPARELLVEDFLPQGVEVVATDPPALAREGRLIWSVPSLDGGQQLEYRVALKPTRGGELQMRTVASVQFVESSLAQIKGPMVNLDVEVLGPVAVGQKALFKIRAENKSSQTLDGLKLGSHLPQGLKHEEGHDIEADLPPLQPHEVKVIDLAVIAVRPGTYEADFHISNLPGGGKVSRTAKVSIHEAPRLQLRKSGEQVLQVGRLVEYRLEVVNEGRVAATDVVVTDQLPMGLSFVAASNNGTFDAHSRTVRWQCGTLAPGQMYVVAVRLRGTQKGPVMNRVVARSQEGVQVGLNAELLVHDSGAAPARPASNLSLVGPKH